MRETRRSATTPDANAGRRRTPRLSTGSVIHAHCSDPFLRILELRNLSAGGFSIETDAEVVQGLERRFEFQALTGSCITLAAVAVQCRMAEVSRTYISGWRFVDHKQAEQPVPVLLDVLISALQFEDDEAG